MSSPSLRLKRVLLVVIHLVPVGFASWLACRSARFAISRQGWPPAPPGTPVFVEYFGWIFMSGRKEWTACATATAASA